MKVSELLSTLEKFAPKAYAETWDNVGLLTGRKTTLIKNILVSLDVTLATVDEAIQKNCNVILSHHPLYLGKKSRATKTSTLWKKIARHDIHCICLHTNLDSTQYGLNDLLASHIGLKKLRPLLPHPKNKKVGLGRVGNLTKSTSLFNLAKQLGDRLPIEHLRYVGQPQQKIKRVAVMTGSGGGFFKAAKSARAELLITGDVKYHQALDALSLGIALIDAGHYGTEQGMVELLSQHLKRLKLVPRIYPTTCAQDPFKILLT